MFYLVKYVFDLLNIRTFIFSSSKKIIRTLIPLKLLFSII